MLQESAHIMKNKASKTFIPNSFFLYLLYLLMIKQLIWQILTIQKAVKLLKIRNFAEAIFWSLSHVLNHFALKVILLCFYITFSTVSKKIKNPIVNNLIII